MVWVKLVIAMDLISVMHHGKYDPRIGEVNTGLNKYKGIVTTINTCLDNI